MAITYPATADALSNPAGTSLLTSPDHAQQHSDANDALEAIEAVLGTTAGTSVLKNFSAGQFAAKNNNDSFGSPTITGGTINAVAGSNLVIGTPRITGGTVSGAIIGTSTVQGGTANNQVIGTPAITGGTASSIVLGTPSITLVTTAATTSPTVFQRAVVPTVGTIADAPAGTITANASSQQIVEVTFGTTAGNRTVGTPTNASDGQFLGYRFKQNSNSTGTLVWASVFRWSSGTAGTATIGTTSSGWTYTGHRYNATDSKWDDMGNSKNIN